MNDLLKHEIECWSRGYAFVAGVDEAGRGPLAGPVVAAAVIFSNKDYEIRGIKDSKLLSLRQRDQVAEQIKKNALAIGIGISDHEEIDRINILQASLSAMQKAVHDLKIEPDHILIDGRDSFSTQIPCLALIKGDLYSRVIAAASIIAKVERDRIMIEYDRQYPGYGFCRHKGYPTQHHVEAIRKYGFCPIHRRSFRIKEFDEIQS